MKLLYLMSYASPEKAASNYLGQNRNEAFADEGWSILLYVPTPCRGLSKEERVKYSSKQYKQETKLDGHLVIHRFSMFAEGENPVFRAMRYILISLLHIIIGCFSKEAKDCDVIFTNSTPPIQGAVASIVKKFTQQPLIYNLQDIFPDSLVGTGLAKKEGLLWKIGRTIENFTYRNADRIIVISEDFKKNIMAKGVPEEKIEVIYNWVDEEAVVGIPRSENKLFDKYNLDRDKFYITYSGNIGLTQNMDMLLEVMQELQTEASGIRLVLIGEGAYKEAVVKKIDGQSGNDGAVRGTVLSNVIMLPFQPYEDISHVFSLGDAGLVISKPGVGANSVPSKTWSIMSASRPVLANFDENELKSIVEGNVNSNLDLNHDHDLDDNHNVGTKPCGIFTKAGDKEAFKEAILKLYRNPELCKEYGRNGRQFILQNLTKEVGTRKYVEVIKSVALGVKS